MQMENGAGRAIEPIEGRNQIKKQGWEEDEIPNEEARVPKYIICFLGLQAFKLIREEWYNLCIIYILFTYQRRTQNPNQEP